MPLSTVGYSHDSWGPMEELPSFEDLLESSEALNLRQEALLENYVDEETPGGSGLDGIPRLCRRLQQVEAESIRRIKIKGVGGGGAGVGVGGGDMKEMNNNIGDTWEAMRLLGNSGWRWERVCNGFDGLKEIEREGMNWIEEGRWEMDVDPERLGTKVKEKARTELRLDLAKRLRKHWRIQMEKDLVQSKKDLVALLVQSQNLQQNVCQDEIPDE